MTNKIIIRNTNVIQSNTRKNSRRSGSSEKGKVPKECKPSTKCDNTGIMLPNMVDLLRKPCTNRNCPYCIL